MELDVASDMLIKWATNNQLVSRLWLFGSRVRGENRPDSDIDIAIELDMSAVKGTDDSGGMATWAFEANKWKSELEHLFSLPVDLQNYKAGETNAIQRGLDRSSILVYKKPEST